MEDGLFGLNAEITRKGFFGGLSAQMLNNRKLLMGTDGADGRSCEKAERVTDRPFNSLCNSHFVILKDGGSMKQRSDVIALHAGREYEARFFMPVNEGMITVTGTDSRVESSGELFRLLANHRGGTVIACTSDADSLDILCTEHDGYLFVSVANRSGVPYRMHTEGYDVVDCTEIRVGEFSFFNNDYEIIEGNDASVQGHGVSFITLKAK